MLKRLPCILVLLAWLALSSGALAFAHNLQHAADDHQDAPLRHDDTNCRLHAQLHSPAIVVAADASLDAADLQPLEVNCRPQAMRPVPPTCSHAQRGPPAL